LFGREIVMQLQINAVLSISQFLATTQHSLYFSFVEHS